MHLLTFSKEFIEDFSFFPYIYSFERKRSAKPRNNQKFAVAGLHVLSFFIQTVHLVLQKIGPMRIRVPEVSNTYHNQCNVTPYLNRPNMAFTGGHKFQYRSNQTSEGGTLQRSDSRGYGII